MTHRSASRCVFTTHPICYLLVPSSRIVLFVIPVVESLLPIVDALSLFDLSGRASVAAILSKLRFFQKKFRAMIS